jgi:isoleucyl-tRNA synthetase
LGLKENLPLIESVDGNGNMVADMEDIGLNEIVGTFFKDADPHIIADLTKKSRVFAAETFEHTYPFCWRCETPLMYFAIETWYIKVSQLRDRLVANNNQISWVPDHIKQGRFGNWLADARDWNFSRNRFWGAPLPIWVNVEDKDDLIVVSSLDELRQLSGHDGEFDMHRPGIDSIEIQRDGKTYKRVEEVFDCWFESGAMPYAQDHYPFENKDGFDRAFPAQFIAEGLDQTRGWFYTLHVLATALFDKPAFQNVVVNGLVLAADGKKLSKRLRNYPDPAEIFATQGADSLRFFLMGSPVVSGEDVRFSSDAVQEVARNVFLRLWNVYSFFTTYAEVDGWQPSKQLLEPASDNVLDRWLLSRLNETITETTKQADQYQIGRAVRPIRDLIDDLSNWYVRRSRRRFWKSEDDSDKQSAYATLHYTLVRIAQLLAPWSPFISDKLWRELTDGMDLPQSVHLSDWPEVDGFDVAVLREMDLIRDAITVGLSYRAEAGIKVRQPLSKATVWGAFDKNASVTPQLIDIAKEELNVKSIEVKRDGDEDAPNNSALRVELDTNITPELRREGMVRDLIRHIQNARKQAGLQVDDRIKLVVEANGEVAKAVEEFKDTIKQETLASHLEQNGDHLENSETVKVAGDSLTISLEVSRD